MPLRVEARVVEGIDVEVVLGGAGPPVLALHGLQSFGADAPFLAELAAGGFAVDAPSHPGFGGSARPDGFDTPEDLIHFYLDVIDRMGDAPLALVGLSFGGWIAAEIAVRYGHRLSHLILVDALGIKVGGRESTDIFDLYNSPPDEARRLTFADARNAPDFAAMSDEKIVVHARNREAVCRYAWNPYLHNPRLKRWLHRVRTPTLVLWGESDGIVRPDYGRAFAGLIPGARFEIVPGAGHHPDIEQPTRLAKRILAFLGDT